MNFQMIERVILRNHDQRFRFYVNEVHRYSNSQFINLCIIKNYLFSMDLNSFISYMFLSKFKTNVIRSIDD